MLEGRSTPMVTNCVLEELRALGERALGAAIIAKGCLGEVWRIDSARGPRTSRHDLRLSRHIATYFIPEILSPGYNDV